MADSGITAAFLVTTLIGLVSWLGQRYIGRLEKERDEYRKLIDAQMAEKEGRLKEQAAEIAELRQQVKALEAEVRRLERRSTRPRKAAAS